MDAASTERTFSLTPPRDALAPGVLRALRDELRALRRRVADIDDRAAAIESVHPQNAPSARNLLHYVNLRRHDIRELQMRLARVGLSSLGRAEPHVLISLDLVIAMLSRALGDDVPEAPAPPIVGFRHGEAVLERNADLLLGSPRPGRRTRILGTLPSEAARDPALVLAMVRAGMDCARINCAHDDASAWGAMVSNVEAARAQTGQPCRIFMDLAGPKIRTGAFRSSAPKARVHRGELVALVPSDRLPAEPPEGVAAVVGCDVDAVFRAARPGQPIWLDDGKVGGEIVRAEPDGLTFRVRLAKAKGYRLKPEKGINLPGSRLDLDALPPGDLEDLAFVARHADAVALSFVQDSEDVHALIRALEDRAAAELAVVLKIEKPAAFEHIPQLLLAAMRRPAIGVMIARGDLAVEVGFERLAEAQEELLWYAEAAHVPTIWATQVLESLAKTGRPSRAEITDAAMSGRAEAVMLNKGPYVVEAIATLDDILRRMQAHQRKKRSLLRPLHVSDSL